MTDQPKVNQENQQEDTTGNFDIDKALDTPGFADFFARQKDKPDINDAEKVSDRFEIFNKKEEVKRDLKKLYTDQINKEMGISLGEDELKLIDAHVEKLATEGDGALIDLIGQTGQFKGLPIEIDKLESELGQLGSIEDQEKDLDQSLLDGNNLLKAEGSIGIFGKAKLFIDSAVLIGKALPIIPLMTFSKIFPILSEFVPSSEELRNDADKLSKSADSIIDRVDALDAIKKKHGKIDRKTAKNLITKTDQEIVGTLEKIKTIDKKEKDLVSIKNHFGEIRSSLLKDIGQIAGLKDVIQKKVKGEFYKLTKDSAGLENESPNIADLEKAKKRYEELKANFEESETGIDPFGGEGENAFNEEKFKEIVTGDMQAVISNSIAEALDKKLPSSGELSSIEDAIKSTLNRTEIGFQTNQGEIKKFLLITLDNEKKRLGGENNGAKRILLSRIIKKLEDGKYQPQPQQ